MLLLFVLALSLQAHYIGTAAAPLPSNGELEITVGWQSDPAGRGTLTIIISCVVTLSLCVWTAIHLNVPAHGETRLQSCMTTMKWVMFGILAPELVVYIVWRQYGSALTLQRDIQKQIQSEKSPFQRRTTRRKESPVVISKYRSFSEYS